MTRDEIEVLFKKYADGNCTSQEKAFLESWYEQWNAELPLNLSPEDLVEELSIIQRKLNPYPQIKTIKFWPRIAAACIAIGFISGGYLFIHNNRGQEAAHTQSIDIGPGSNKAILTLSNGKKVNLGENTNGEIAQQASVDIHQKNNQTLTYTPGAGAAKGYGEVYNTMTTPRGGQFSLVLADGTKVWLNASSSIKYPANFTGSERKVEITGEVYFEVSHNAAKPFKVLANKHLIEDIGTHFNVNCYDDEAVLKTTLLEGSIRVFSGKHHIILSPGQQSQIDRSTVDGDITVINDADLNEALSWKNGIFKFHNTSIASVMRQLSRWYDVDIKYEHGSYNKRLTGEISRNIKLSQVLEYLKFFNIKLRVDQYQDKKQIVVLNK